MRLVVWAMAAVCAGAGSVATHDAPLRSGCAGDSEVRATVPAGSPVTIRSMMSGETAPCYKIAATVNGKSVEGYLDAGAIGGAEEFDKRRREAESIDWAQVSAAAAAVVPAAVQAAPGLPAQAMALVNASQPQKALELLAPQLKNSRDPDLLAVAGAAAWRADDIKSAAEYWRASLELRPNPQLQALYDRLQRESRNDTAGDLLIGMRVQLRYERQALATEAARQMLGTLDQEYARITAELGCPTQERVVAVAQSREAYLKATQAAEWSGGEYDGRIHVPVGTSPNEDLRPALAHEMVHACLTMIGRWPTWFQEGVAQKLSGQTLSTGTRKALAEAMAAGRMPRLAELAGGWMRMDPESARLAYAESLAAIELFYENHSGLGLRNLVRSPERLPGITGELDRLLRE